MLHVSINRSSVLRASVFAVGAFYLLYHALHGERGLYAYVKERHALTVMQAELKEVKEQRVAAENRVDNLRSESLDLDLLDEQMRRMLGVMGDNEVVVLTNPQ